MLKLTKSLFLHEPKSSYIDFYERTLYNHILSSQHPEHGGLVYFTPIRPHIIECILMLKKVFGVVWVQA
jgi:DUF1680 family protein